MYDLQTIKALNHNAVTADRPVPAETLYPVSQILLYWDDEESSYCMEGWHNGVKETIDSIIVPDAERFDLYYDLSVQVPRRLRRYLREHGLVWAGDLPKPDRPMPSRKPVTEHSFDPWSMPNRHSEML